MLTIRSQTSSRDCGQTSRRDFLRVGALGLGGFSLPSFLASQAQAGSSVTKDKAVILLFLCGGASQIETFDPKMTAPAECRSATGEIPTTLPGVTFGGTFPQLAKLADRLAVVRSYQPHGISDHAKAIHEVFTVGQKLGASMGSIAARLGGGNYLADGTPVNARLIAKEVDSQYQEDEERMTKSSGPGQLGARYAPFDPIGGGQLNADMMLNLPLERLQDRLALLGGMDQLRRQADAGGAMEAVDEYHQRALDMILGGGVRKAIDLKNEDARLVERYDTSHFTTGFLTHQPSSLGQRLLIARRLVEAGCRFVTVGMAGWDNHGNGKHPGVAAGMELLGRPLDHAVSAFLEDVKARGLEEKILLVITSEFGRTPKIQASGGGRDHWPSLCPLVFAGGGFQMGQVIGQSTSKAEEPASDPITMHDLLATLLHAQFDVGAARLQNGLSQDVARLLEMGNPIQGLV